MIRKTSDPEVENNSRLELALEEFLSKRGVLDIDEWLSRYPDCTSELLEFLNNQVQISPLAAAFSAPVAIPACRIGDYEILEILDRGGMGVVYKARQNRLRRIVALKMIQQGQFCSSEVRQRFQNEAETAARLRHPNLVAIHEVGEHNGIPFFSMEFVKGRTLADLARQGRIRPNIVAQISQSIAETIHYIHTCGVLHRDLKPSNIMIDDQCQVRVTDFGLAKQLDRQNSPTETGQILGSIDYMPPEQAEARHEMLGPSSDVYSIGAIMYELLTGKPPFRSDTFLETLRQIREQSPVRPTQLNSRVPVELEHICLKCLQKKPSRRYSSAAELAAELERFVDGRPIADRNALIVKHFTSKRKALMLSIAMGLSLIAAAASPFGNPFTEKDASVSQPPSVFIESDGVTAVVDTADAIVAGDSTGVVNDTEPAADRTAGQSIAQSQPTPEGRATETLSGFVAGESSTVAPIETVNASSTSNEWPNAEVPQTLEAVQHNIPAAEPQPSNVVSAHAVSGQPFGVAKIELLLTTDTKWRYQEDVPMRVLTDRGKAMYSAFHYVESQQKFESRPAAPAKLFCWFLFGDKVPTTISLMSGDMMLAADVPIAEDISDAAAKTRSEHLSEWWGYFRRFDLPQTSPELVNVRQYFESMLARRLNLQYFPRNNSKSSASALERNFERTVGMLFGFESIRLAMMAGKKASAEQRAEAAVHHLPAPLTIRSVNIPRIEEYVRTEPMSMRVPEECFYLRCFRVQNYHWIRNLVQGWGGSLDGIVATPAVNYQVRQKIEKQLALSTVELLKASIDNHITDCSLIGLDPFFHDGAAVGVLFEEKSGGGLEQIITAERTRVTKEENAFSTVIRIQGQAVQKLYSEHHQVRSFYVRDGRYHLVTNSEMLAKRFLETASGTQCLGKLNEYKYSLTQSQNDNHSLAWLYLSDPFFRNITSPQYRIEFERRQLASDDLNILQTARMAAFAEGLDDVSTSALVRQGFLPAEFNQRPDHSRIEFSEGEVCDSHRGIHGTFLPIADRAITQCTRSEWEAYEEFKRAYQREWRTMDPVMLTFNRKPASLPGRETVILNIRITPYAQQEYRFLQQYLSPRPDVERLAMGENDLMVVCGKLRRSGRNYLTSIGLVDEQIPYEIRDGKINRTGRNARSAFARSNAYALVNPGGDTGIRLAVDFIGNVQQREVSVESGPPAQRSSSQSGSFLSSMIRAVFSFSDIYQAMIDSAIQEYSQSNGKATVLSMDQEIGRDALEQLHTEDAPRPAQLFMQLRDVTSSRVYDYLRAYTFVSSRRASAGDAATLNRIADMVQADPSWIRQTLESNLGATFMCPAGGDYQLIHTPLRPPYWSSSAWSQASLMDETAVPHNYQFPFLTWLRGMNLECSLTSTTLQSRLELDVAYPGVIDIKSIPVEIAGSNRLVP